MSIVSTTASRSSAYASRLVPWQWAIAIVLLLALFFQLTRGALRNSVTFDEGQHIARGYVYAKTGDLRFEQIPTAQHPPLMEVLAAAPLLFVPDLPEVSTLRGWAERDNVLFAKQLVWKSPQIEKLTFAARVPMMWVTLLLAAIAFRWARDLLRVGPMAGLLALGLCAFDPNLIANGMLATSDLGAAAFGCIALYALWKCLLRPSTGRLIVAGLTLGVALLTKTTMLVLLPVSALLILAMGMTARRTDYLARVGIIKRLPVRSSPWKRLLGLIVMAAIIYVIGFLVIWAFYGFEIRGLPGVPLPVPAATHLQITLNARKHLDVGHPSFLMGQVSTKGWWYYFPVAFLLKTPIPLLILLPLMTTYFTTRLRQAWKALPLVAFVCIYAAMSLLSTVNIGYRHLLPILPCLFVLVAQIPCFKFSLKLPNILLRFKIGYLVLGIWYIAGTLGVFPNYLTYFNEFIGGPKNGYQYLVDSNLDWGQSLIELRSYMAQHHLGRINLSATGFVNPAIYGVAYDPLPPMQNPQPVVHFDPKPGQYYIGAQNLQIGSPIDHDVFGWFRERKPDELIGNAILVYNVPKRPAGQWVAQCAMPVTPLDEDGVAGGFGRGDLRMISFDCQTSWVYPAREPGWYLIGQTDGSVVLPPGLSRDFQTKGLDGGQPFTVYRLDAPPDVPQGRPSPASVGPLTFLGFALDRTEAKPGQTATLTTYWRVESGASRLISLMAHLVTADGQMIANGDGLGVPIENWQTGDVIVQRHVLTIPRDAQPGIYQVQTGVYTLEDLQRFPVVRGSAQQGDQLFLASVTVKR